MKTDALKGLADTAREILKDDRHWSLVDVADRAESAKALARAVLEAVGEDEGKCPAKCLDCREHAANTGNEEDDKVDDVKKAVESAPGRFIQVEYDVNYTGGNYSAVGDFAYLEMVDGLCEDSVEERFEKQTGASRENIVSYSFDELYAKDADGEFVPEDEIDEDES